jgi:hypothetical protein
MAGKAGSNANTGADLIVVSGMFYNTKYKMAFGT